MNAPTALAQAVPDDGRPVVSPSSLSTFDPTADGGCPRKWAWRKLGGVNPPPNPSAALGTDVHTQAENYFAGKDLDLRTLPGEIAFAGHHLWPARDFPDLVVERPWILEIDGVLFGGRKDLEYPGRVIDHKTTKDLRWKKSPEDLAKDYQATLYGLENLVAYGGDFVDLRWIYYRTKPPHKAEPTDVTLWHHQGNLVTFQSGVADYTPQHTINKAVVMGRLITRLMVLRPDPREVPANVAACDSFGGCPFQGLCNLTPQERIRAIMTNEEMLAQLAARVNPAAPHTTTPTLPQVTTDTPPGKLPEGFTWAKDASGGWVAIPVAVQTVDAPVTPAEAPAQAPPPPIKRGPGRPKKADVDPAPVLETPAVTVPAEIQSVKVEATIKADPAPLDFPGTPRSQEQVAGIALVFAGVRSIVDGLELIVQDRLGR